MKLNIILDRIQGMTEETYNKVRGMMRDGYGGHGITLESDATTKQVNACFALDSLERHGQKYELHFTKGKLAKVTTRSAGAAGLIAACAPYDDRKQRNVRRTRKALTLASKIIADNYVDSSGPKVGDVIAPCPDFPKGATIIATSTERKPPKRATRKEIARIPLAALSGQRFGRATRVHPKPHLRLDDQSFLIPKPLAYTRELDAGHIPAGVRLLRNAPDYISMQIRTTGRMGGRGSKCRFLYSQVMLDAGDVQAVIDELQRLLPEIV
jgi:hypothetical protein